jgi:transcriptional regulator GlxA family with amidase domain
VFSTCTGSFASAEAGLLDNRDATTHWAFAARMKAEYPAVIPHPDRILVAASADRRIVTCGGAASRMDMVLYLVGRFASPVEAMRMAKIQMLDWHHQGQMPYSRLTTRPPPIAAAGRFPKRPGEFRAFPHRWQCARCKLDRREGLLYHAAH